MNDHRKGPIVVGILAVLGIAVLAVMLMGTQVSTILSKVGSSVTGGDTSMTVGEAIPEQAGATAAPESTAGPGSADQAAARPPVLLIVRTGTLTLETARVADAVSAASGIVVARGGFVAGSQESGANAAANATVDFRIPAGRWEETLASLRGVATVRDQKIETDEVTGAVIDLGARITNLRTTEAALQAIMAKAVTIEEILDVQQQLTETRGQIEELSAQKASLEDRAAFGSLTVIFQLPPKPKPSATVAPTPAWDPGEDVQHATDKLVRLGQRATSAGIWFGIVGVPILGLVVIAIGATWATWRFVTRRRASAPAVG